MTSPPPALHWLNIAARLHPDRLAIVAGDVELSYAQLHSLVAQRAKHLAAMDIRSGSRVAIIAENSVGWLLAAHAILMTGATLVPLHHLATAEDLRTQLSIVPVDLIIRDASANIPSELGASELTLEHLNDAASSCIAGPSGDALPSIGETSTADSDDTLVVLFTSGTTGTPRAVPLSAANIHASAMASAERLGLENDDRWLCCLPLCHMGGLATMLRSLIYATTLELAEHTDMGTIATLVTTRPITRLSLVPTQVHRLLTAHSTPLTTSLRAVLVGGGPVDAHDLRAARKIGLPLLPTYGMSEAASQITTLPLDAPLDMLESSGSPLPGTELRITLDDGSTAAPGQPGAIKVRGPTLTRGYLNKNADALYDNEGWMRTGDVGHLDERGFLYIHHRASERIVSGGENIDPTEVERALRAHPHVTDLAVFALDHPEWGQQLCCALVLSSLPASQKDDQLATLAEFSDTKLLQSLNEHCRTRLAPFKIPRRWFLTDAIPRTPSQKVRRHRLAELATRVGQ
ncbi:2-succinylbenzoate--CoA ligase [Lujinxingia sediminis]|uniref:2-succinylbenzoate--CoA ligase n=1 Tax=Lujinxingia sediminis TaxID=2480984 RepID=A0ABY0CYN1_9DELT|nr:AMP-binding protein [Lujinxingia sediminis]RVU48819.1 2-succinylbenzoate--CoA ligase [Lujinxingia sediminis]